MIATALLAAALLAGCGGSSGGGAGVTAQASVTISSARQYQRIAGFGVSEGFGQAKTLMNAPAPVQQQVLSLLYSPTRGAGLTILRNEISADAWSAPRVHEDQRLGNQRRHAVRGPGRELHER